MEDRIGRAALDAIREWQDHKLFAEASLSVRMKTGQVIPYTLAPAPLRLHESMERQRLAGKPIRQIVLKARQVYISTAVAARFFHAVPFTPGQTAMIVSHESKSTENLFGYYDEFRRSYKPFRGVSLPPLKRGEKGGTKLEWTNGSYIDVHTANNLKGGRSFRLRYLHLSEFAFWRNATVLMGGLMSAVPDDPGTIVVVESTANGVGGEFYDMWLAANDPSSGSAFSAVFFAWWEHPEYTMRVEEPARFQASLSKDELELQRLYNLTLGQLAWRRWAIRNKCQGSIDLFRQEYPSCPEEAFIMSGRPRFSHTHLGKMRIVQSPRVGELQVLQNGPREVIAFNENEDGKGVLSVYKRPEQGHRYVIGGDPAGGSDANERPTPGREDPDYSVDCVLDADTGEQVAKLRGRMQPAAFAEYTALLGEWYNWAYIVPEINGEGRAYIDGLIRSGYPLSLIYHRRPAADEQFTSDAASQLDYLGWKTTTITRPQLISTLDQAIRELAIAIRDKNTLQECRTFVIKPTGRQEHQSGCHDDEVFALALGVQGVRTMPRDKRVEQFRNAQNAAARAQEARSPVQRYGTGRYSVSRDAPVKVRF